MRETRASGPLLKHRKNVSRHQNRSIPLVPRTAWRQPTYWLCGVAKSISQAIRLRIGINLGDIIIEDDGDVIGDGVNVAARLEQIAEPGGGVFLSPSTSKWHGRLIVHLKIAVSSTSRTFLGLSGFMRSRGP